MTNAPLWSPTENSVHSSPLSHFILSLPNASELSSFKLLHRWSITHPGQFWSAAWEFLGIRSLTRGAAVLRNAGSMPGAEWFPDAKLNFAENLLRKNDDTPALIFRSEKALRRVLSYRELRAEVERVASYLQSCGVAAGDRVAGFLPNMPEAAIGMLATASIGAIWSSCSPDFGVSGVVDRFGQIEPKVLIAADGYHFKGDKISTVEKLAQIVDQLPSLQSVLVAPLISSIPPIAGIRNAVTWNSLQKGAPITFAQLPFAHPLYIMYSSGTTGKPKCIVHGAGGTLLEHLKELVLHSGLTERDVLLYQTTCGWMMWNWMISALAVGCPIVLYDGSPLVDDGKIIFDILEQERVSVYGTSAKFLSTIEKEGLHPRASHNLSELRSILSTGSVLLPESFDYVYSSIKPDLCLSSISGGTDIIGCFTLGSPTEPVYRGETQALSLGMDVQVFSQEGVRVRGEKGELVCTQPFPSMPIYFWNDPDGSKYRKAYFERFPGVWHHGDYVMETEHGGLVFYGRSDATLKPGGVRIGTAEIYRQVETLPEIAESIVVGQDWEGDVRIVLFVKLTNGAALSEDLIGKIKSAVRTGASPFHVPKKILAVTDIPRTRSNKIAELAVRDVIHGKSLQNIEALANPESLAQYRDREELKT